MNSEKVKNKIQIDQAYRANYALGDSTNDKVLCNLCGRTHYNGIRCLGMCVEESDY